MARTGTIVERVIAVVDDELASASAEKTTVEADRLDDLGADSLDRIEIVMEIEAEFGIYIGDEAADRFETVGDMVAHVTRAIP